MRGMGQIRELARIARPEVGVITNVGPVHLELVGTVERVAEAKAELIAELRAGRGLRGAGRRGGAASAPALGRARDHVRRRSRAQPVRRGGDRRGGRRRARAVGRAARATACGSRSRPAPSARRSSSTSPRPTTSRTRSPRSAPLHALGVAARGARGGRAAGALLEPAGRGAGSSPDGVLIINDCYNANPVSMRAAIDHLAAVADRARRAAHGRGARRHARAGPGGGRSSTARSARTPPTPGVDAAASRSASTPATTRAASAAPAREAAGRRARRPTLVAEPGRAGRRGAGEGARAASASSGSPRRSRRRRVRQRDGRDPDRGARLAADLDLPRARSTSSTCATREFGQHIREEGPAEHHVKAGTPTMGGLVIFTAIGVPVPDPVRPRRRQHGGVRHGARVRPAIGFADDWLKIVKARSLGLSARTKLALQLLIAIGLWCVAREVVGLSDTLAVPHLRRRASTSAASTWC